MTDYENVASQFTKFYYQTFQTNRAQLAPLYRPTSLLTFESSHTQGGEAIVEKLVGLPFTSLRYEIVTTDAQPGPNGSIQVLVTGYIQIDDTPQAQIFAESFLLMPDGGSYYIAHDIFKLIYPPPTPSNP